MLECYGWNDNDRLMKLYETELNVLLVLFMSSYGIGGRGGGGELEWRGEKGVKGRRRGNGSIEVL